MKRRLWVGDSQRGAPSGTGCWPSPLPPGGGRLPPPRGLSPQAGCGGAGEAGGPTRGVTGRRGRRAEPPRVGRRRVPARQHGGPRCEPQGAGEGRARGDGTGRHLPAHGAPGGRAGERRAPPASSPDFTPPAPLPAAATGGPPCGGWGAAVGASGDEDRAGGAQWFHTVQPSDLLSSSGPWC